MPTKRELQERLTAARDEVARLSALNRDLGSSVVAAGNKAAAKAITEIKGLHAQLASRDQEINSLKRINQAKETDRCEMSRLRADLASRDQEIKSLKHINQANAHMHSEVARLRSENDMLRREMQAYAVEGDSINAAAEGS